MSFVVALIEVNNQSEWEWDTVMHNKPKFMTRLAGIRHSTRDKLHGNMTHANV